MLNGEFNEDALEAMYQELSDNLQLVDNGLRRQDLLGKPVDEIKPQAASALATVGVHLPEEKLTDYAHALSSGEKYAFDLAAKRPERTSMISRWFRSRRES